jgi:hypothetical protein
MRINLFFKTFRVTVSIGNKVVIGKPKEEIQTLEEVQFKRQQELLKKINSIREEEEKPVTSVQKIYDEYWEAKVKEAINNLKTLVDSRFSQAKPNNHVITGKLVLILPEDYRADLEALRYRWIYERKLPTWRVQIQTAFFLLDMLWGCFQVKIQNYLKSTKHLLEENVDS